jgi:hypothetical protein
MSGTLRNGSNMAGIASVTTPPLQVAGYVGRVAQHDHLPEQSLHDVNQLSATTFSQRASNSRNADFIFILFFFYNALIWFEFFFVGANSDIRKLLYRAMYVHNKTT